MKYPESQVRALPARHRRRAEHGHRIADGHAVHAAADLDHRPCALVSEDDRRIVPKRVVEDVQVRSADAAERDLHFHEAGAARRLVYIAHVDVARAGRVLDDCFHAAACFASVPTRAFDLKNNSTRSRMANDIAAELIQNDDQFLVTTPARLLRSNRGCRPTAATRSACRCRRSRT